MYKAMTIIFLSLFSFIIQYFLFTLGWGLEVRSWGWLIFLTIISLVNLSLIQGLMKEK